MRRVSDFGEDSPGRVSVGIAATRLLFNGLLLVFVALGIGFLIFIGALARAHVDPPHANGIAVLTGGSERIKEAIDLLARGKAQRLLISGVYRDTTKAQLEKLTGTSAQYFECCVDLDHKSRNTIDNATAIGTWAAEHHYHSIIVVTSNYHMPRALAELSRAAPRLDLIPYPVIDKNLRLGHWWLHPGTSRLLLSEYLKYLPALARLSATRLANKWMYGTWRYKPEDLGEP